MEFIPLSIQGAFEIVPKRFPDERGIFTTTYDIASFGRMDLPVDWVADNMSFNFSRGTLRGLHFQKPPYTQAKLVRTSTGKICDVFVDLRPNSPSYMKWASIELSDERANSVYIPAGCAHGYLTLSDNCVVNYKVNSLYMPESEGGVRWNDPIFGIVWPVSGKVTISPKDQIWPLFDPNSNPFAVR